MAKDYFIADTHFGGEKIRRYENRPFETAVEMDEKLIENWNGIVTEEDTVYVLGDFSDYAEAEKDIEILQRLSSPASEALWPTRAIRWIPPPSGRW